MYISVKLGGNHENFERLCEICQRYAQFLVINGIPFEKICKFSKFFYSNTIYHNHVKNLYQSFSKLGENRETMQNFVILRKNI